MKFGLNHLWIVLYKVCIYGLSQSTNMLPKGVPVSDSLNRYKVFSVTTWTNKLKLGFKHLLDTMVTRGSCFWLVESFLKDFLLWSVICFLWIICTKYSFTVCTFHYSIVTFFIFLFFFICNSILQCIFDICFKMVF